MTLEAAISPFQQGPPLEVHPCWNQKGVNAAGTCTELAKFVHCRNCPVYSQAAVLLLNRPLPAGYRRERTEHFARQKRLAGASNASAVIFRVSGEWLALPTPVLQEIAERRCIHSLPHHRQGFVLGLANVRGELIICISLGHLLGQADVPSCERLRTSHHRLIVACRDTARFAFAADEVYGTQRFHWDDLKEPPGTPARSMLHLASVASSQTVSGTLSSRSSSPAPGAGSSPKPGLTQGILYWQDRAVGLLNVERLFSTLNGKIM
jgi:chemotaxis-related protein WspD